MKVMDFLDRTLIYQIAMVIRGDIRRSGDPFRVFRKSYARYRKAGWSLVREKIDQEYRSSGFAYRRSSRFALYDYREPIRDESIDREIATFERRPLISVVMPVYNVEPRWLEAAIESLRRQWYGKWELCIADDASSSEEIRTYLGSLEDSRIKVVFLERNRGISGASNEALKLAGGEYVALMDNDDELTPDALYEVVKAINENDAEFVYSDEDKIEMDGRFSEPHFKPDFAPDMFLSQNYLSHLGVIKRELIEAVGGWEEGLEGSQDYDLYLKVSERTDRIVHIPKVLYHWRKIPGSTAAEYSEKSYAQEAGRKALENAMKRRGVAAKVRNGLTPGTYKVEYTLERKPLVSIVIPFKDKPELLRSCIESILEKTTYKDFEIIGISNNSEEEKTLKEMHRLSTLDNRVRFYEYNVPFNYSQINNYAVKEYARGEQIVLMNNDIEIITPEWIEEMLMFSRRKDVGAVGAKLYYPDDTIQHAGITIGLLTLAGHNFRYLKRDMSGYMGRAKVIQNVSAVTAALLMVKRDLFFEIGAFNERELAVTFNDVDFCLRLREKGYLNVWTPWVEAYHHESKSRGSEDTPEKQERFTREVVYMQKRWREIIENGDPYYNPNLSLNREDFSLKETV